MTAINLPHHVSRNHPQMPLRGRVPFEDRIADSFRICPVIQVPAERRGLVEAYGFDLFGCRAPVLQTRGQNAFFIRIAVFQRNGLVFVDGNRIVFADRLAGKFEAGPADGVFFLGDLPGGKRLGVFDGLDIETFDIRNDLLISEIGSACRVCVFDVVRLGGSKPGIRDADGFLKVNVPTCPSM